MNPPHRLQSVDHYEVGREKIREFARAVQDLHPAHWNDDAARALGHPALAAPATFLSSIAMPGQRAMFDRALAAYPHSRLLHLEQEIHLHRPVYAGDRLTCELAVDSVHPTANGDLITVTTAVRDSGDSLVQAVHTTLLGVDGTSPAAESVGMQNLSIPLPQPREVPGAPNLFPATGRRGIAGPELAAGQRFPPRTYRLSRGDLVNYAGVCGDNNPIHWNDTVARDAGLSTVVAHGMLTMGLGAAYLTECLGVPVDLADYAVNFANPVYIGPDRPAEVEFTAAVRCVDERDRHATLALTARSAGQPVFSRATARIPLGSRPEAEAKR
ncbi:fused (3R)-hydroxyacyl-ACP dehydratase subunits HadA/HadB [Nocardia mexicana]|uniref:Acyl dehydratase n=1 Tax=Nocardia mexicana TaxID=279262 RepID=A0A370H7S5_9NOCA|nr:fused (3R)-hydroxyacyl-ACP dehydratase subunits HadA/HadB [Nocardia mexicana]RDI52708.1 acyl dehydratase [Nocardia mexicana]